MVNEGNRERPRMRAWKSAAIVFAGLSAGWAILITTDMLIEDPAGFHCDKNPCSVADIATLVARNASVAAWLILPYFLTIWALRRGMSRFRRRIPSWLFCHPRMLPAIRAIFIAFLGFGQIGAALGTYMMLEHNPQDAYCVSAASATKGNYFGYGPCHISLGELTLLFAENVYVIGALLLPFALLGLLIIRLIAPLRYDSDR